MTSDNEFETSKAIRILIVFDLFETQYQTSFLSLVWSNVDIALPSQSARAGDLRLRYLCRRRADGRKVNCCNRLFKISGHDFNLRGKNVHYSSSRYQSFLTTLFLYTIPVPKLQNLCMDIIIMKTDEDPRIKTGTPFLPEPILSRLEYERRSQFFEPMPKYDQKRMRAQFSGTCYPLNKFFSEKDERIFLKDFVDWFRNDASVFKRFRHDCPVKIVFFHFKRLCECKAQFPRCMECMKRYIYQYGKGCGFERHHCLYNDYPFSLYELQYVCNWCRICKRVPLFQILSPNEFEKQYGNNNRNRWVIKTEEFL